MCRDKGAGTSDPQVPVPRRPERGGPRRDTDHLRRKRHRSVPAGRYVDRSGGGHSCGPNPGWEYCSKVDSVEKLRPGLKSGLPPPQVESLLGGEDTEGVTTRLRPVPYPPTNNSTSFFLDVKGCDGPALVSVEPTPVQKILRRRIPGQKESVQWGASGPGVHLLQEYGHGCPRRFTSVSCRPSRRGGSTQTPKVCSGPPHLAPEVGHDQGSGSPRKLLPRTPVLRPPP